MELWERIGVIVLAVVFLVLLSLFIVKTIFNPFGNKKETNFYEIKYRTLSEEIKEIINVTGIHYDRIEGNTIYFKDISDLDYAKKTLLNKIISCFDINEINLKEKEYYGYMTIEDKGYAFHIFDRNELKKGILKEEVIFLKMKEGEFFPVIYENNKIIIFDKPNIINKQFKTSEGKCYINENFVYDRKTIKEENIPTKNKEFLKEITLKKKEEILNERKKIIWNNGCSFEEFKNNINVHVGEGEGLYDKYTSEYYSSNCVFREYFFKIGINNQKNIKEMYDFIKDAINEKNKEKLKGIFCYTSIIKKESEDLDFKSPSQTEEEFIPHYNKITKEISFYLPMEQTYKFDISWSKVYIYLVNENGEIKVINSGEEIKKLCDFLEWDIEKYDNTYFLSAKEKISNFKLEDIKIPKEGVLVIIKNNNLITPFGKYSIEKFNIIVKNSDKENIEEGLYCLKSIRKEEDKFTLEVVKSIC